jgi:DNA-binding transcriptional LysR family regulator
MDIIAAFKVFVRVAEAGSFSAVAREQNISQPAISRQIAALEDHLGERLLQRTTRSLTLTDDGRDLLNHARRVLDAVDEAETAVGRRRGTVAGLVRLCVPVTFGRLHLAPALPKLLAAHPHLEIDLLLRDSMPDLVGEGIDLAIRPGEVADSTMIIRRAGAVSRYVIASTAYVQAHGEPAHPQDLAAHECVQFSTPGHPSLWQFQGAEGPLSVEVHGRLRSDSGDAIREAVLNDIGIAALPAWYFRDEIAQGRVKLLLRDWEIAPIPVLMVYPSRRNLSPRVRAVMDFLFETFDANPMLADPPRKR